MAIGRDLAIDNDKKCPGYNLNAMDDETTTVMLESIRTWPNQVKSPVLTEYSSHQL
ncbi:MAG: hypothetical protein ACP5NC_00315 [Nitrososphaeria archaeon]